MKKILLSCVTCLLALGLVTACDNEDEVVENDGTVDTGTGGGSGDGTTQGGGATDVTTLYSYTLELTLTDEDGEDPIPSYASAYIVCDLDWYTFLPLTGEDKVYSYTFESIDVGWYEFKAVMWYTDETVSWENCVEIVTVPYEDEETGEMKDGNAYFEVVASQGDDYTCKLEYTVTETLDEEHTSGGTGEPVTLTNYTVSFSFVDEAGAPTTLEAGYTLYLQGSWAADEQGYWDDEWIECPYDGVSGYYVATFESIDTGTYTFKGVSCATGSPSWNGEEVVTGDVGSDATLTVTETNSGQVIESVYIPPVYLSNYTLCFTLTSEEEIPDYVALYISGDFNGWALDALTEEEVLPEQDLSVLRESDDNPTKYEVVYTYTIESISVGTHEYKVIACYIDDVANWEDCIELIAGAEGGNATFEVVEEESDDGYTHAITYEIPQGTDFTTLQPEVLTNVTLSFTFYATDGVTPLGAIPDGYGIAVAGDFALNSDGGWNLTTSNLLTAAVDEDEQPTGAYTYTISSITSGTYQFRFLYEEVGEGKDLNWYHPLTSEDLLLKIGKDTSDSTIEYDVVTIYDDYENIIHPIDSSVTTDFYIVLLDASGTNADCFANKTVTLATGGNYFSNATSTTSVTFGTSATSGVTYLASPKGTASSWTIDWFTFYVDSWDPQIACDSLEIPATTEGYCAVYVAYANLDVLLGSSSDDDSQQSIWGGYWIEVEDTSTDPSDVSI